MGDVALNVELREQVGKGVSRRLRGAGRIPAIVYGKGMASVPVSLDLKEFSQALAGDGGHNKIMTIKGGGQLGGASVIVADIYRDRFKGTPYHVDLHKINMSDKVKVKVPVHLVGEAIGAKEGGLVDFAMHELEVECAATKIPERLDVDITGVGLAQTLHVGDVVAPEGVTILDDPKASVVSILGRKMTETPEEPAV